jgi:hypothetical protein
MLDRPGARNMAEVTYDVARPFIAGDDGMAAGEPTECFDRDRHCNTSI